MQRSNAWVDDDDDDDDDVTVSDGEDEDNPTAAKKGEEPAEDEAQEDIRKHVNLDFEAEMERLGAAAADDDYVITEEHELEDEENAGDVGLAEEDEGRLVPRQVINLINVLNIVVTAFLTRDPHAPYRVKHINLMDLVVRGARLGFQLNKRRFAAAIVSCVEPTCCVLIFEKGNIVCAGCSNLTDAKYAINRIVEHVSKLSDEYANLKAVDARVCNMVGSTCFPSNIDVHRLHDENPQSVENPIANGVKMAPPPASGGGPTLVYESGYVLVIGAESRAAIRSSYHHVHPTILRYMSGSAESTFSMDKIRRYYTSLKNTYEHSQQSPHSYIAVCADGTEGTVDDWRRSMRIAEKLEYYRKLIEEPGTGRASFNILSIESQPTASSTTTTTAAALTAAPAAAAAADSLAVALVQQQHSQALTKKRKRGGASTDLVNVNSSDQLSVVRSSSHASRHVRREAHARHKATKAIDRQLLAARVLEEGAEAVVQQDRPKQIKVLSMREASQLYTGESR